MLLSFINYSKKCSTFVFLEDFSRKVCINAIAIRYFCATFFKKVVESGSKSYEYLVIFCHQN